MIVAHEFGDAVALAGGGLIRRGGFAVRSRLPLNACRAIAVGVGQRLHALLGIDADVELIAPSVPSEAARRVLFEDAHVVRAKGQHCDVYAVVRRRGADTFVARAFGEETAAERALSEMERSVLDRIAANVLALCGPLCGTLGAIGRVRVDPAGIECASYFEVRPLSVPEAAFGFALTREPSEPAGAHLRLEDLRETRCYVRVEIARGQMTARDLAHLSVGSVIRMSTQLEEPGRLRVGGHTLTEGTCGECEGRAAFLAGVVESAA